MENITDIEVTVTASYPFNKRAAAGWQADGARFHVWFDVDTKEVHREYGTKKLVIYKNPPLGIDHKSPDYFKTRYLDGDKPCNEEILRHVFGVIERDGLIAKAIETANKKEQERQAANAEAARQERIKQAAPRLVEALRGANEALKRFGYREVIGFKTDDADALLRELGEIK